MKEIIPEGSYRVRTPNGYVTEKFDRSRLERIASTANQMIGSGLSIPMPLGHRDDAVPIELDITKSANPAENNGYWGGYFVDNSEGVAKLYGWSDLEGSEEDKTSPYYLAKHKIKEVSSRFLSEYTDGKGRTWKDATLHTALVLHPVVPGQKGFEDVPMNTVSMSALDYEDESNQSGILRKLKEALKKAFNVELSDDCTPKTVLRDLYIAVNQFAVLKENSEDNERVPVYPITMSSLGEDMKVTIEQAKVLVGTKAVNPATQKPFALADFGYTETPPVQQADMSALQTQLAEKDKTINGMAQILKAMKANLATNVQQAIVSRIDNLVASGRVTKEIADTVLRPKLTYDMSILDDGSFAPHPLETTLSTFEMLPAKESKQTMPQGIFIPRSLPNDDNTGPLEGETLKSILDAIDEAI
jgi:hypothetical protein